jgi:hypothetical protein
MALYVIDLPGHINVDVRKGDTLLPLSMYWRKKYYLLKTKDGKWQHNK